MTGIWGGVKGECLFMCTLPSIERKIYAEDKENTTVRGTVIVNFICQLDWAHEVPRYLLQHYFLVCL